MTNRYMKTSIIETIKRKDCKEVAEDDKPCFLSETLKDSISESKKLRRSIVIILENKYEYDQIKELLDSIIYQKKLINYYGLDTLNCKWDLRKFPITKTDKQMEGMQSDIQKYNETVQQYNEYSIRLGFEYGIDISSELNKGCKVIFRPPQ